MKLKFAAGVLAALAAATFFSWAPMALLLTQDLTPNEAVKFAVNLFLLAAVLNGIVGIPVSIGAYRRIRSERGLNLSEALLLANALALFLLFLCVAGGGLFGLMFFGLPILVASNVWAAAGWSWAARPMMAALPNA